MPVLVRPYGYHVVGTTTVDNRAIDPRTHSRDSLNLLHFGTLSPAWLEPSAPLGRLINSGYWREVKFAQYGSDWIARSMVQPASSSPGAAQFHGRRPSPLRNYDAASAFGYPNSLQMPSKAVQYLTLAIPRVAITSGAQDDAFKPGWLCSQIDSPALAERLREHVSRPWSAAQLVPPPSEAWPHVADEIASFVNRVLAPRLTRAPRLPQHRLRTA